MSFFFLERVFKPTEKSQILYGPTSGEKHSKFGDSYLIINFPPFNQHHYNRRLGLKIYFSVVLSLLRLIILLWADFQGHDKPLKTSLLQNS